VVASAAKNSDNGRLPPFAVRFMTELPDRLNEKRGQLLALLASYGSCAVAFSGGVDSSVLAKAAQLALGDRAVAVTGTSASLAEGELEAAQRLAALIGVRHMVLATDEVNDPVYAANAPDRCYHCKTELYTRLWALARREGLAVVTNGTIVEDMGDHRPGIQAAREHDVRSPLADCGLTKADVRQLAEDWQLPVADKPAMPCLSSRIAYGQEVTPERLRMIDGAEQVLRGLGLRIVRVRYHAGDVARLEVPLEEIAEVCQATVRTYVVDELKRLGFKYVTIDLEGFRSGSLNELLPLIEKPAPGTP
jgi:pyridinium-3,5-biscarboxylic acid mononucleotide sulfurtransferase